MAISKSSKHHLQFPRCWRMRGATLIELMVGLLLGVVVILVVAQVLFYAEGQKRATTSGSDAQVNGALALYTLQREMQMAGYGLVYNAPAANGTTNNLAALGCAVHANHSAAGAFNWLLAPAVISAGADGAPDSVTLLSSSRAYAVPATVSVDHPITADRFTVRSSLGIGVGDMVIAIPAVQSATQWCAAYQVTQLANTNQVVHGGTSPWNNGAQVAPGAGYLAGDLLVNAGQMVNRRFSLTADYNLQQQTLNLATGAMDAQNLFPQIVNLRALYGKDTNGDGVVDSYDNVTPTDNAGWRQVLAVRLALVARSEAYQKEEVTQASPQWDVGIAAAVSGASTCGDSKCLTLKVDSVADWKHYRYGVFDVTVPLRNVIWGQ